MLRRCWPLAILLLLWLAPAGAALAQEEPWRELPTASFLILYRDGDAATAQGYAGFVDAVYTETTGLFGDRPQTPIALRLYPTLEDYYVVNPAARGLPGIVAHADYQHNEVAVLLPQLRQQPQVQLENTIRHELTHIIAADLSGNRLNVGFQEGVAQFMEKPSDELDAKVALLRRANESGTLLSWADLDSRDKVYSDPEIAYPQTLSVVAFLVERGGFPKLRAFLEASATASGYRSALEQTYGAPADALEREWLGWLPGYVGGGYRNSPLTSYDLSGAERLLVAGQYAAANQELQTAVSWLTTTQQTEKLAAAQAMLDRSVRGQQADELAKQAQAALDARDYGQVVLLAERTKRAYNAIGDTRLDGTLDAFVAHAERAQRADVRLADAQRLAGEWLAAVAARRAADEAAGEFMALGDAERARQAMDVRGVVDARQRLAGGALLACGLAGAALSVGRRLTAREQEAW